MWAKFGYPVSLACAMISASIALDAGINPLIILGIVSAVTMSFVIGGEVLQRFNSDWRPTLRENYYPDIVTVLINNLLLQSSVVQLTIAATAMSLAGGGLQWWPRDWPLWLQVPLALLIGEFGSYWWHRASHEWMPLWRFHKLHHSPTRLYWLNATKFHYVDMTLLQTCATLPLLVLGADKAVILFLTLFSTFHGYWQHGNTRQNLGWLNYIFSSAELHRWHHNERVPVANNNYGSNLIFWDLVFGTYLWPEQGHGDTQGAQLAAIGIADKAYPIDPFRQLVRPFSRRG